MEENHLIKWNLELPSDSAVIQNAPSPRLIILLTPLLPPLQPLNLESKELRVKLWFSG